MNFRKISVMNFLIKKKQINPAQHLIHWGSVFQSTLKFVFFSILDFFQGPSSFCFTQTSLPCCGLKLFSVCMGIAGSSLTATQMSWILLAILPASVSPEGAHAYLQTHSPV